MKNQDKSTVDGFGDEWSRFDQSDLPQAEQQLLFDEYFSVFPWKNICLLYTSPSPRDRQKSRLPSSA